MTVEVCLDHLHCSYLLRVIIIPTKSICRISCPSRSIVWIKRSYHRLKLSTKKVSRTSYTIPSEILFYYNVYSDKKSFVASFCFSWGLRCVAQFKGRSNMIIPYTIFFFHKFIRIIGYFPLTENYWSQRFCLDFFG